MDNLNFDSRFVKQIIDKGIVLLKNPFITSPKRKNIKSEIEIFNNFLTNGFENENEKKSLLENPQSIMILKKQMLKRMKKIYVTLGEELIINLIEESKNYNGESNTYLPCSPQFTIEDQIEETLEMYKNNSSLFYTKAKEIISNSQIHVDYELNSNSWVFYSEILKTPLLIVDPSESSSILVTMLQKAIELSLGFEQCFLLNDLGPLYFELLYNEQLFLKYKIFSESYNDRINDFRFNLSELQLYLQLILKFSKMDFKVETQMFLDNICDLISVEEKDVIGYLNSEVYNKEVEKKLTYCISFLKAIELKEKTLENRKSVLEELNSYLKNSKKKIENINKLFLSYERFCDEIKCKSKKYKMI